MTTVRSSLSKQSSRPGNATKKSVRFADEEEYPSLMPSAIISGVSSPIPASSTASPPKSPLLPALSSAADEKQQPLKPLSETPSSLLSFNLSATTVGDDGDSDFSDSLDGISSSSKSLPSGLTITTSGDSTDNSQLLKIEFDNKVIPSKCPVEQGILNDCWLLASALSFWRSPEITNQFAKQVSKFCYLVRLWNIGCEWEAYRIHLSNLPQSGAVVVHSQFADYIRYVEAAFIAYFQGAENLAKALGDPVESNVWLSGGFAERMPFNQSEVIERRIFAIMNDRQLFTTVQQSGEKQRHSAAVVQWEKLPFGHGYRYLVVDSNLAEEAGDESKLPSGYSIGGGFSIQNSNIGPRTPATPSTASSTQSRRVPNSRTTNTATPGSGDSKTELIAQIAKTQPNLTVHMHDDSRSGALTGWYTPQRLVSTFDSCTVCRPLIHEDPQVVQRRMVQLMSSWMPDVNSGGSRRNLEQFATNPQFVYRLRLVGDPSSQPWSRIDGQLPWLWVSLCQPFRFDKSNYCHIAFHVYKLPHKEPPTGPLRASFFLHTGELFSSLPYANYSMATRSYSDMTIPQTPTTIPRFPSALHREDVDIAKASAPVVYLLVVPSTYFPVKARTEFLLRVYSEIGELSLENAWNFDPKTVNVPWTMFNPDPADFAPPNNNENSNSNSAATPATTKSSNATNINNSNDNIVKKKT